MAEQIVIIGAVAAGMSAASKIRRINKEAEINVYTDEEYISYAACGLPYFIGGVTREIERLIARTPEQFKENNIHVHLLHKAEKIVPDQKKVIIKNTQETFEKGYDKLLIATGSDARKVPLENDGLQNIYKVRKIPDAINIKKAVERGAKKVVIVGAGYIGIEMVEIFKMLGLEVIVVEAGEQVLSDIDPDMAEFVTSYLKDNNVSVFLNEKVTGFQGQDVVSGVLTNKQQIDADLVILTLGSEPATQIASDCGIELTVSNAIKTNEYMQTNIPDIYAAGDCTAAYHVVYERDV